MDVDRVVDEDKDNDPDKVRPKIVLAMFDNEFVVLENFSSPE